MGLGFRLWFGLGLGFRLWFGFGFGFGLRFGFELRFGFGRGCLRTSGKNDADRQDTDDDQRCRKPTPPTH